jgi:hypothetical protein
MTHLGRLEGRPGGVADRRDRAEGGVQDDLLRRPGEELDQAGGAVQVAGRREDRDVGAADEGAHVGAAGGARQAALLAVDRVARPDRPPRTVTLPTTLVRRGSGELPPWLIRDFRP